MSELKTAQEYLQLAQRYARAREIAADNRVKNRLFMLEQSYLAMAKGAYALEHSEKLVPPD